MGFLSWLGGIVLVVWLFLFFLKIGGWLIHILLVASVIVFLFDWITGRKKAK